MKKISKRIENISDINGYEEIATLEQRNMKGGLFPKMGVLVNGKPQEFDEKFDDCEPEDDYDPHEYDDILGGVYNLFYDPNYKNKHSNAYSSHGSVKAKYLPMEREKY